MSRAYTVAEIQAMRAVLLAREMAKIDPSDRVRIHPNSAGWSAEARAGRHRHADHCERLAREAAEMELQTYMLGGIDPNAIRLVFERHDLPTARGDA